MKKAFTLVELIFTIVIMAGVFAVIPKILNMTNKSDSIALKQDALLQAVSLTNIASFLAWDANNSATTDIQKTSNNYIQDDPPVSYIRAIERINPEILSILKKHFIPIEEAMKDDFINFLKKREELIKEKIRELVSL